MGRYDETKIGYMDRMFSDLSREEMFDVLMDKHEALVDCRNKFSESNEKFFQDMLKDAKEIRRLKNKLSQNFAIACVLGVMFTILLTKIN